MNNDKLDTLILDSWINSEERMFPLLNKLQRIWEFDKNIQFLDLLQQITNGKTINNDLELTKILEQYIDEHTKKV